MIRIILDAELRSKLGGFHESIELVDESGKVVGQVVQIKTTNPVWPGEPPLSAEEISKCPARTYTSEEVLAGLRDR